MLIVSYFLFAFNLLPPDFFFLLPFSGRKEAAFEGHAGHGVRGTLRVGAGGVFCWINLLIDLQV